MFAALIACYFLYFFSWWFLQHILLGAVPFPSDVLQLKELGVCGVVTLNESYERLVPQSLYEVSHLQVFFSIILEVNNAVNFWVFCFLLQGLG
jgi:hypothetical protein